MIMNLVYIDDVVAELISALQGHPNMDGKGYCHVPVEHQISLGGIVELLKFYKESRGSKWPSGYAGWEFFQETLRNLLKLSAGSSSAIR